MYLSTCFTLKKKNTLFVALISTSQTIFSQRHWCTGIIRKPGSSSTSKAAFHWWSCGGYLQYPRLKTLDLKKKKTLPNSDRNAHLAAHGRVIASEARWRYALNVNAAECLSVSFDLLVRSVNILAGTVSAWVPVTLVDVVRAIRSREARCTRALVAALERATLGPVSTGRRGAIILSFAVFAWKKTKRDDVVPRLPTHYYAWSKIACTTTG